MKWPMGIVDKKKELNPNRYRTFSVKRLLMRPSTLFKKWGWIILPFLLFV